MILPIGQEENRVFRQPWVTYGIMALCVALFLLTHFTGQRRLSEALGNLQQAVEFYRKHPYLTPDPRLYEVLRAQPGAEASSATPAPDGEFSSLEQVELDGLTKAGFEALGELPERRLGLVPAHFSLVGLLMHMFMHAGVLHLLGNLLFLYLSAPFLEDVWGRRFFSAFYLSAGAVSGTFFALRYPGLEGPLVGASGAIAGVIGAFLIRHWRRRIRFFYWFGFVLRGTFTSPAWVILPLYFLREILAAWSADVLSPGTGGAGVAYWAHVSGFGFGAVTAVAVRWLGLEEHFLAPALEAELTVLDNSAMDRVLALRAQGSGEEAWMLLSKEVRRNPGNSDAVLVLWEWARESGRTEEAGPALVRLVRELAQKGEASEAYAHWVDVRKLSPRTAIPLGVELRLSEVLSSSGMKEEALEVVEDAAQRANADTPVGTLVRLSRLAKGDGAARAAALALGRPDLSPDLSSELERIASRTRRGRLRDADSPRASNASDRASLGPGGTRGETEFQGAR